MKKMIYLCFTIMLFFLSACSMYNNSEVMISDSSDECISQIYELHVSEYTSIDNDLDLNHRNVISDKPQTTVEENINKTAIFQTSKKSFSLNYVKTLHYPVGEKILREYSVEGYDGSLYLQEDGSVSLIAFDFMELDISKYDPPEAVLAKLKPAISDIIDISKYQHTEVIGYTPGELNFESYIFKFYNMIHGYRSDFARVAVSSSGTVSSLSVVNNPCNSPDDLLKIDNKLVEEMILLKLMDIYNTETFEYRDHEMQFTPNICTYDGEVCIEYSLGCHIYNKLNGSEVATACRILIPVRLLISAEDSESVT